MFFPCNLGEYRIILFFLFLGLVNMKSSLQKHIKMVHEGEKPPTNPKKSNQKVVSGYVCRTCNQSFPEKTKLLMHIRTVHDNQKLHSCSKCDSSFAQKSHLIMHMTAFHEGKKLSESSIKKTLEELKKIAEKNAAIQLEKPKTNSATNQKENKTNQNKVVPTRKSNLISNNVGKKQGENKENTEKNSIRKSIEKARFGEILPQTQILAKISKKSKKSTPQENREVNILFITCQ